MDADRVLALARSLASVASSRRRLLAGVAGSAPSALAAALGFGAVGATPIGCRHWKERCRRHSQCCSGLCQGRQGEKTCRAHDRGGCALADNFCAGGQDNRCHLGCICNITTGQAPHCGSTAFCPAIECQRDEDCGQPGAACIPPVNCQGCGSPATQNFCQQACSS